MVTLELIEQKQAEIEQLIHQLKASTATRSTYPISLDTPSLKDGEIFVGHIVSPCGTFRHALILLPGETIGTWEDCQSWALKNGGSLPDRPESALLFALSKSGLLKGEFKAESYWTSEAFASDTAYAWGQHFGNGYQNGWDTYGQSRARAVRRLVIQ